MSKATDLDVSSLRSDHIRGIKACYVYLVTDDFQRINECLSIPLDRNKYSSSLLSTNQFFNFCLRHFFPRKILVPDF
ncbi:hypothetical protein D3C86_1370690 [compost metagenome]